MSENFIKPDVLKFRPIDEYAPKYKYRRIPIKVGGDTSFEITDGATVDAIVELPANTVYNLSESFLPYELQISNTELANGANVTFEDTFEIADNVYFGTNAGLDLCSLNDANKYLKIRNKMKTSVTKLLSNDNFDCIKSSNMDITTNIQATPYNALANNVYEIITNAATYDSTVPVLESRYLYRGPAELDPLPAANLRISAINRYRHFKLGNINDTIFSMNKDLYFGANEMVIRFRIPTHSKIGFVTSAKNAPTAANSSKFPNSVKVKEFYLYLAVETNEMICKQLIDKYNSGTLKMQIPYTVAFKKMTSNAGTVSIQQTFNRSYGKKIKHIMHTVWNPTEQLNTVYDCDNWNGMKFDDYQTYLDSVEIQQQKLSCKLPTAGKMNHGDWLYNKKYCKDSAILNGAVYQHNWFHMDQFYEDNKSTNVPDENLDVGLPMTLGNQLLNRTWTITGEATGSLMHITYVTFLRDIAITPDGVLLDASGPMTSVTANASTNVTA